MKKTNKTYEVKEIANKFVLIADIPNGEVMEVPKYRLPLEIRIGEKLELDHNSMFRRVY